MIREIIAFEKDEHNHWRALLSCGHYQHVRHNPPWQNRSWVVTKAKRFKKIGSELDCMICQQDSN